MQTDIDISGAFKVGSWLTSVDTHNREQLLKSCQDWTSEHTTLLLEEIASLVRGESILGLSLIRTDETKLVYAASLLERYRGCPSSPIAVGLALIV